MPVASGRGTPARASRTGAVQPPGARPAGGRARALLRAARPHQWLKNVLVLAAPAAAGVMGRSAVVERVGLAFAAFCALASGGYLLNDVVDRARDRSHPVKRLRPVASGALPVGLAVAAGGAAMALGLALAAAAGLPVLGVALAYLAVTSAYSLWLKHAPVVEMALLASVFVLRAAAGGEAAHVHLSRWLLVVVSFGALFVVAGKRHGEVVVLGEDSATTRRALARYPISYLRFVWGMAATVAVAGYCLWAFSQAPLHPEGRPWLEASVVPFVLGVLRYALLVEDGQGGAPEEVFLRDRLLQLIGVAWVAIYLGGVYAAG